MEIGDKLYVITRDDLSLAHQSVMLGHAAIAYCFEHEEMAKSWHQISDYLCYLSVHNEKELIDLIEKAHQKDIHFSIFREEDINNEIVAIALSPGDKSKKLCSGIKLAFKGKL